MTKRYFEAEHSAQCVIDRMSGSVDARHREIFEAMIKHLHAFVKEVEPTGPEWFQAIEALTQVGKMCEGNRQEWILMSDALGVSMLVDSINNPSPNGETENTVLGPFHVPGAPQLDMGTDIRRDGKGETCVVSGCVLDAGGKPISGAELDVWSDGPDGFYDVQKPDEHPPMNLRGRFITGEDGTYSFTTAKPVSYPIPDDGPVGKMLELMGRHPWRPAHIHFRVNAPGYDELVTHIFVEGDRYIESDAVFGVKESLIVPFRKDGDQWQVDYDFILRKD